LNKTKKEETSR